MRPGEPATSVVRVTYRPRLREHTTTFGVPCSSTRQYTGIPASAYMTGLTARSIDTVDGDNLRHGQNSLARNPRRRLTDCSGGCDHDGGNQELPAGQVHVHRSGHLGIGACGGRRLGESAVQPVGRPPMPCSGRRAHDKNPTFVDLKAGMITGIRQRLDIIRLSTARRVLPARRS